MLLSIVVAIVVYLASVARIQSRQVSEAASQLDTLFQSLPGMAYRCTGQADRSMEFVSDGCLRLSGYNRSDLENQSVLWGDLIHAEDRERVSSQVRRAVDTEDAYEFEYRIATSAGEERWVWERGRSVVRGVNEDIRLEGFISDITARKRAEVALVESRAFSEAVVDTAVDAVITIGENGEIGTFNRAAQQMLGYSLEEVIGKNVSMLMPEPYHSAHDRYLARYLQTGESGIIGIGREIVAQRKDGSQFPIFLSVNEVPHWPERQFVGMIRDLSDQRAAENEARQHRENLAHFDRLNMLGEMATGIAHEINQPLTAISLFAQAGNRLLQSGKKDRISEIFEKLTKHSLRASAVIQRMQNMARRQEGIRETISCLSLCEEVAKLAEAEAGIRDMTIEVKTEARLPDVAVDTVQIQQVALNLLRNGMESMQSVNCCNGTTIRLQTGLNADGDILVSVIDSGSGVTAEVAEKLFTPFSTTKKSGMGMGLSISRAIIIAHGGHLNFFNNESSGATFFFTLPPVSEEESDE
jgi:two-component system sensor kinase FixL